MKRLGITVCTRQRPEMLRQCLLSICASITTSSSDCFVVIVENSVQRESRFVVEDVLSRYGDIEYYYQCEPEVGIPFARNRSIDVCLENNADWLAFIDDDEVLSDGWVDAMFRGANSLEADALTGPVQSALPISPPVWWEKPKAHTRPHGASLDTAATNNTLIDCRWLRTGGPALRFDTALRFTGGSDFVFFYRLTDLGGKLKWVADASVTETVSDARMSMQWHLNRKARTQANNVRCFRNRKGVPAAAALYFPTAIRRLLKATPLLIAGVICRPFSKARSERLVFLGLKSAASAVGAVRGLVGWELQPYRKIEGY